MVEGGSESMNEQLKLTLEMLRENMRQNQETTRNLMEENRELRQELRQLREQVHNIATQQQQAPPQPQQQAGGQLRQEMDRKYRRKRRTIIQNKILEHLRLQSTSIPELKEIIVDEHGYCSKATFYRYVKELTDQGVLRLVNDQLNLVREEYA